MHPPRVSTGEMEALLPHAAAETGLSLVESEVAPPGEAEWTVLRLTGAVRAGNERAFLELHTRYYRRLTRYALVMARGDENTAAETVQAAFLRAIRHLRPLPDEAALWAWLARAARSAAADAGRSRRRYATLLTKVAALFSREQPLPDETESIWFAALEAALAGLDPDEHALVEARYFQRLSLHELAASLTVSERAVEGRLARLREKLRRSILQHLATAEQ